MNAEQLDQLKHWISKEIARQVYDMKKQLNREIAEHLNTAEIEILARVREGVRADTDRKVKTAADFASREVERLDKKLENMNNAVVVADIAANAKNTREVSLAVGQQVYTKIMDKINNEIVPKVNNMVQWVNYNMQDGGEVADEYRRAVEMDMRHDTEYITDGKSNPLISPHVRLFFED